MFSTCPFVRLSVCPFVRSLVCYQLMNAPVVTLSRPPTISSLKITDRSFRYASPRLWNQLPDSFRQPHHSRLDSITSSTSQLVSVIIPTLVIHHSFTLSLQAQNLPFQQILPTVDFFYLLDCLTITGLDRTYQAISTLAI